MLFPHQYLSIYPCLLWLCTEYSYNLITNSTRNTWVHEWYHWGSIVSCVLNLFYTWKPKSIPSPYLYSHFHSNLTPLSSHLLPIHHLFTLYSRDNGGSNHQKQQSASLESTITPIRQTAINWKRKWIWTTWKRFFTTRTTVHQSGIQVTGC